MEVAKTNKSQTDLYAKNKSSKLHKASYVLFLLIVGSVFFAMAFVFLFFPRSKYSELEKRDLAIFPAVAGLKENPSKYTSDISFWFSDSEPYRDEFMTLSMHIRDMLKLKVGKGEDIVSFIPAAQNPETTNSTDFSDEESSLPDNPLADENAKIANAGIIVVGTGPDVRALMAYGGSGAAAASYVKTINKYAETFPNVNIYALPIPTATEFYLPEKAAKASKPQKPTIDYIQTNINPGVKMVDAYSQLAAHIDEDIYLRTDHHWAPLGAFYAAKAIAEAAGVPFKGLDNYDKKVVHGYVGSMYGYSKDISVKNAPEDFVYYIPKGVNAETTFITYVLDENFKIKSQRGPYKGRFFHEFKDGSGGAYCTFMGGDTHTVKIQTGTPGSRRVMIIKDSYGNPLPSYLFYSFAEIHIVDFRYFTQNMQDYVRNNGITDIVLAFNVFNVCSSSAMNKVQKFLDQSPGIHYNPTTEKESSEKTDSVVSGTIKENTPELKEELKETPELEESIEKEKNNPEKVIEI